jgi:hypothetical protein
MLFVFYEARFSKTIFQKKGASKGSHSEYLICWQFHYDTINKVNRVAGWSWSNRQPLKKK